MTSYMWVTDAIIVIFRLEDSLSPSLVVFLNYLYWIDLTLTSTTYVFEVFLCISHRVLVSILKLRVKILDL